MSAPKFLRITERAVRPGKGEISMAKWVKAQVPATTEEPTGIAETASGLMTLEDGGATIIAAGGIGLTLLAVMTLMQLRKSRRED